MTIRYASICSGIEAARPMRALDLFSAAAGGWSLGLHRAGFVTVAACEVVEWRRILYSENNPGVHLYDDVRTLTADRIISDLGYLPDIIVGSPPCQDISSANTKGKGIKGERSGLYLEAVRLVGECRPRWFSFENSANLRTRGADAVLDELEALGYACWPFVVRASDVGANHERARSWLIGCDVAQVGNPTEDGRGSRVSGRRAEPDQRIRQSSCGDDADTDSDTIRLAELPGRHVAEATIVGNSASHPHENREPASSLNGKVVDCGAMAGDSQSGGVADAHQEGRPNGSLVASIRQAEVPYDGRGSGWSNDGASARQMGLRTPDRGGAGECWPQWSIENLAHQLRLDDGLPAWVADTRIATGSGKRTSAASLIVEAFGDAVVPQIPEAIGRAILRVEAAE
ncbi:DNA cytosine methyltransferase [Pseudochelatococcus sp. B33]